jgi:hypothetical protein
MNKHNMDSDNESDFSEGGISTWHEQSCHDMNDLMGLTCKCKISSSPVYNSVSKAKFIDNVVDTFVPIPVSKSIKTRKHKSFVVEFKESIHQRWLGNCGTSIYIGGKEAPPIKFERGVTYTFKVIPNGDHKFYLSLNPGATDLPIRLVPGSFAPIGSGTVTFVPDCNTPEVFYYADTIQSLAGYRCAVFDDQNVIAFDE